MDCIYLIIINRCNCFSSSVKWRKNMHNFSFIDVYLACTARQANAALWDWHKKAYVYSKKKIWDI